MQPRPSEVRVGSPKSEAQGPPLSLGQDDRYDFEFRLVQAESDSVAVVMPFHVRGSPSAVSVMLPDYSARLGRATLPSMRATGGEGRSETLSPQSLYLLG